MTWQLVLLSSSRRIRALASSPRTMGGPDVFVHISAIASGSPLRDGQKVSYETGQDRKTGKSRAENVSLL